MISLSLLSLISSDPGIITLSNLLLLAVTNITDLLLECSMLVFISPSGLCGDKQLLFPGTFLGSVLSLDYSCVACFCCPFLGEPSKLFSLSLFCMNLFVKPFIFSFSFSCIKFFSLFCCFFVVIFLLFCFVVNFWSGFLLDCLSVCLAMKLSMVVWVVDGLWRFSIS